MYPKILTYNKKSKMNTSTTFKTLATALVVAALATFLSCSNKGENNSNKQSGDGNLSFVNIQEDAGHNCLRCSIIKRNIGSIRMVQHQKT